MNDNMDVIFESSLENLSETVKIRLFQKYCPKFSNELTTVNHEYTLKYDVTINPNTNSITIHDSYVLTTLGNELIKISKDIPDKCMSVEDNISLARESMASHAIMTANTVISMLKLPLNEFISELNSSGFYIKDISGFASYSKIDVLLSTGKFDSELVSSIKDLRLSPSNTAYYNKEKETWEFIKTNDIPTDVMEIEIFTILVKFMKLSKGITTW